MSSDDDNENNQSFESIRAPTRNDVRFKLGRVARFDNEGTRIQQRWTSLDVDMQIYLIEEENGQPWHYVPALFIRIIICVFKLTVSLAVDHFVLLAVLFTFPLVLKFEPFFHYINNTITLWMMNDRSRILHQLIHGFLHDFIQPKIVKVKSFRSF